MLVRFIITRLCNYFTSRNKNKWEAQQFTAVVCAKGLVEIDAKNKIVHPSRS